MSSTNFVPMDYEDTCLPIEGQTNRTFIFLPFSLDGTESDFINLKDRLTGTGLWDVTKDNIRHLYRYITDKMDSSNAEEYLYFHVHMTEQGMEKHDLGKESELLSIRPNDRYDFKDQVQFRIESVQLFSFRTMINIVAVELVFEENDPMYLATGLYYLKKPGKETIWRGETDTKRSLLQMVKELFEEELRSRMNFFFYLNSGMERANTMSLTHHKEGADLKRELYFLKHCYREKGFDYSPEQATEDEELITADDYVWGITEENLSCIITKDTKHIRNAFVRHFGEQYLFMYVLLLHRKYDLYRILTDIGVGIKKDIRSLEHYRELLYEYQTDYAYERITEVPQYHKLYSRLVKKMDLDALFEDAMEPISSLSHLEQEKSEEKRAKRDHEIGNALALLSGLTVFSALIDCYSYIDEVGADVVNLSASTAITGLQFLSSIGIIGIFIFVLIKVRKN